MTDEETKELTKRIKTFLNQNERSWLSAATMQYAQFAKGGKLGNIVNDAVARLRASVPEDQKMAEEVAALDNIDDIERWMRKDGVPVPVKLILYQKMAEHEDEVIPVIQKRILRSDRSEFIENVQYFLIMYAKDNYSDWLLQNIDRMKSPYARSSMCIVIGFKGDLNAVEPMMKEANYLKVNYKDDKYWEGPVYAVDELYHRFILKDA